MSRMKNVEKILPFGCQGDEVNTDHSDSTVGFFYNLILFFRRLIAQIKIFRPLHPQILFLHSHTIAVLIRDSSMVLNLKK
ncbi:MAG: hypothetical protein V8Q27_07890 [Eubacteriales bacterium]